jgi:hypothetical protein
VTCGDRTAGERLAVLQELVDELAGDAAVISGNVR